jgi:5-hydroxyisourate hydrolase-like protein (transthyretin family)
MLFLTASAFAAVTGTVINKTTGQPQAGATVALNKLDPQLGITLVDQAKSDAQGKFTISQDPTGRTPYLIRTAFDGVTYNHMLPPGTPATGVSIEVYNASKQPGSAKVSKHMVLFEPTGSQMEVNETYLFENAGQTAWNDPGNGTLHFFLPAAAEGKVKAEVTAPGGMPIGAPVAKTDKSDVFEVDYPVKPGETRFDLTYSVPYTEGAPYQGKIVTKDDNTYLIVPNGVTLAGEGLNDLGQEPKTQARLYGFTGTAYNIQLTGTPAAAPAAAAEADGAGPQIEQMMPRLYDKAIPILALALGILALGFALLYRAHSNTPAKESDARGRG